MQQGILTSASANDGQVRLTLIEGGLAPYTINGKSLKKNELVEIDGCGYGETKVNVKDGKGVEFDYTIEINIPNHKIVSMPQNCSGRGGEIVVTCDENDLKLKGYFIKQNGSIVEKIYSTSNNCTFSGLALGDYEVWGVFDNGDQILLSGLKRDIEPKAMMSPRGKAPISVTKKSFIVCTNPTFSA